MERNELLIVDALGPWYANKIIRVLTTDNTIYYTKAGAWVALSAVPVAHAASHADGGTDEITITGLSGLLADAQNVGVRKNSAGTVFVRNRLNFIEGTNVTLTVADDGTETDITINATTAAHASSHQDGGGDEISVTGLSGLLADAQKVGVRKNSTGSVFTRPQVNFIEGTGVTLTVADDGSETDVTIAASATPSASLAGQVLYSVDGATFAAKLPVTDPAVGWLVDGVTGLLIVS